MTSMIMTSAIVRLACLPMLFEGTVCTEMRAEKFRDYLSDTEECYHLKCLLKYNRMTSERQRDTHLAQFAGSYARARNPADEKQVLLNFERPLTKCKLQLWQRPGSHCQVRWILRSEDRMYASQKFSFPGTEADQPVSDNCTWTLCRINGQPLSKKRSRNANERDEPTPRMIPNPKKKELPPAPGLTPRTPKKEPSPLFLGGNQSDTILKRTEQPSGSGRKSWKVQFTKPTSGKSRELPRSHVQSCQRTTVQQRRESAPTTRKFKGKTGSSSRVSARTRLSSSTRRKQ